MATPRELVTAVAKELEVPESTVIQHDRNLSVAGLRTTGGRGRGAARVTYDDAANLLIAVAACRNVKDSVATVLAYRPLISQKYLLVAERRGAEFGDALAAIMQESGEGRLTYGAEDHFECTIQGPTPFAFVSWGSSALGTVERKYGQETSRGGGLKYMSRFAINVVGYVGHVVGHNLP